MRPRHLLMWSASICASVAGCDKSRTAPSDPASSFRSFASNFETALRQEFSTSLPNTEFDSSGQPFKSGMVRRWAGTDQVDVRKTDSLVQPYVGTLKVEYADYPTSESLPADPFANRDDVTWFVAQFAYGDGKWNLQSARTQVQRVRTSDVSQNVDRVIADNTDPHQDLDDELNNRNNDFTTEVGNRIRHAFASVAQ